MYVFIMNNYRESYFNMRFKRAGMRERVVSVTYKYGKPIMITRVNYPSTKDKG